MMLLGLKLVCTTIVALAGYGVSTQYMGTKFDQEAYLPIGQMVDIGGYRLHMVDSATCDLMQLNDAFPVVKNSKFTVVMDAGFACNCLDWSLIQPQIAQFARVIRFCEPIFI